MQLGAKEDPKILRSDVVVHGDGYNAEGTDEDPRARARSGESDVTCVVARGNNQEAFRVRFRALITDKLGYRSHL